MQRQDIKQNHRLLRNSSRSASLPSLFKTMTLSHEDKDTGKKTGFLDLLLVSATLTEVKQQQGAEVHVVCTQVQVSFSVGSVM